MKLLRSTKAILLFFSLSIIVASVKILYYNEEVEKYGVFDRIHNKEGFYQFLTAILYISIIGVLQWLFQWLYYNIKDAK